jgi:hypothetical protein
MARIGYGVTKKEITLTVKSVLDAAEEDDAFISADMRKFKDNLPSKCWIYRFLSRYPDLAARIPENLGNQRAYVTESIIRNWFVGLETFLKDEHDIDAKTFLTEENASRIFNLDESGFPLAGTNGKLKIITTKGAKNVYKMAPDTKEQITVLGCAAADGKLSKPYVIFPGVRPTFNFTGTSADYFDIGVSQTGWISADCFFGWLANLFLPSVINKVQFPIIIFMDGHTSHMNIAVAEFCRDNNIILYCFPAHASHVMQPLDVSVYGPLKKFWNDSLDEFCKKYKGLSMSKTHFFPVFHQAWVRAEESPQNVKSGFRKTGLVPFNPDAVGYDRLVSNKPAHAQLEKNDTPSIKEKIGIMRAFQIIETNLTEELRDLFNKRLEEGYDLQDETALGVL